ncbi:uncharacterized protein LOC126847554 [Adelges cooleyi]|uniref:uncharacterized protein LOC126847554 n=1 Tax=Adelges cooleyi TaxID=133065 RepID=UPI0021801F37|nr:uncharacterized protein LOC126847554 [Adelges cooleyi]
MSFKLSILLLSLTILTANSVLEDEYELVAIAHVELPDGYNNEDIDMDVYLPEEYNRNHGFIIDFDLILLDPEDPYEALYPERRTTNVPLPPTEPVETEGPSETQAMDASIHSSSCTCEPDPNEAEILRDSYNYCRSWNNKGPDEKVTRGDFWLFMGKNQSDNYRIQRYYLDHPSIPQGPIDLDGNGYGELFKYICQSRGVTVADYVENRKKRAEKQSLEETGGFKWQENN